MIMALSKTDRRKLARQHRQENKTKVAVSFVGGIPNTEGFDVLYQRYSKLYDAAENALRPGEQMYLAKKRKASFKDLWLANYNQAKKDGTLKGKTDAETANWIVNKIVEEQKYFRSKAQAASYQEAFKYFGEDIDIHGLRGGRYEANVEKLEKDLVTINNALKNGDEITLRQYIQNEEDIKKIKARWAELMRSGELRASFIGQVIFGS